MENGKIDDVQNLFRETVYDSTLLFAKSKHFRFEAPHICLAAREIRIFKTDLPADVTAAQLEAISTLSAYDIR